MFVSVLLHKNGLSKSVWVIKCESMDYHFFSASHNTNTHNVTPYVYYGFIIILYKSKMKTGTTDKVLWKSIWMLVKELN